MGMRFVRERDLEDPVIATHRFYFSWIKPYIKNAKILDIGCWTGPMEQLLEKEACSVTAIDIESQPLALARKRFPRMKFVKASIITGPPFKNGEFDTVFFFMVLEHIPKGTELSALMNINRVLKKGGNLFLTTMNGSFLSIVLDPAYFLAGHRHYSKKHLAELLKEAGFAIREVHYNGGFFLILYTWLLYFFKHVLRRREPRGRLMNWLIALDYHNRGFTEIDIRAAKAKELSLL